MYICIVYQITHFISARETKEKLDGIYTLLTTVQPAFRQVGLSVTRTNARVFAVFLLLGANP